MTEEQQPKKRRSNHFELRGKAVGQVRIVGQRGVGLFFSLSVSRKDQNDQWVNDFYPVTYWAKSADIAADKKRELESKPIISVEGSLGKNKYVDKKGVERDDVSLNAFSITIEEAGKDAPASKKVDWDTMRYKYFLPFRELGKSDMERLKKALQSGGAVLRWAKDRDGRPIPGGDNCWYSMDLIHEAEAYSEMLVKGEVKTGFEGMPDIDDEDIPF